MTQIPQSGRSPTSLKGSTTKAFPIPNMPPIPKDPKYEVLKDVTPISKDRFSSQVKNHTTNIMTVPVDDIEKEGLEIIKFLNKFEDVRSLFQKEGGLNPRTLVRRVFSGQWQGIQHEFEELNQQTNPSKLLCDAWHLNESKNRYRDIKCNDATRVVLDYIHANYVDSYKQQNTYICCQGPTDSTIIDFWKMVWQEKVLVIVMLTRIQEGGKEKCSQYWPEREKETQQITPDIKIHTLKVDTYENWIITRMRLYVGKFSRLVEHLMFITWPDYEIPSEPEHFLHFVDYVRKSQKSLVDKYTNDGFWRGPKRGPPIVIHCSAGVGRTGTFCTVDICQRKVMEANVVNVKETVRLLRNQRCHSVQKLHQYMFIYLCLVKWIIPLLHQNKNEKQLFQDEKFKSICQNTIKSFREH